MAVMRLTTPKRITDELVTACRSTGSAPPVEVRVEARPDGTLNDCFRTVSRQIESHGGRMIVGRTIWENSYCYCGELHAVWQPDDGSLVDVTPKQDGERRIIFVETPDLCHEWQTAKPLPNIWIAKYAIGEIQDLFEVEKQMHSVLFGRPGPHTPFAVSPSDQMQLMELQRKHFELQATIDRAVRQIVGRQKRLANERKARERRRR
jgi:hypothetical protein